MAACCGIVLGETSMEAHVHLDMDTLRNSLPVDGIGEISHKAYTHLNVDRMGKYFIYTYSPTHGYYGENQVEMYVHIGNELTYKCVFTYM